MPAETSPAANLVAQIAKLDRVRINETGDYDSAVNLLNEIIRATKKAAKGKAATI